MTRPIIRELIPSDMTAGPRYRRDQAPYAKLSAIIARAVAEADLPPEPPRPPRPCKQCGLEISGDNARAHGKYTRCRACDNARKAAHYRDKHGVTT